MAITLAFQKKADYMDRVPVCAGWSKKHQGACLGDGVAFQEKAGSVAMSLFVQGGAEDTVERVLVATVDAFARSSKCGR